MTPEEPNSQGAPEFDRTLGVGDLVHDSKYGDQRYHLGRSAVNGGKISVNDLYKVLHEVEQTLRDRRTTS
ncbi:hypothetical protein [Natrinema salaciae]|uniref:hypothetical protein n=1 Tax=Natrinema salaciae TaxID=1186196 RepID=UPI00111350F3|nr:hypothetical protein [Natrinema salaciae]